jgi:hypothetical protein
MRVLVLCEYSGVVREAFRKLGHDAWSCDLLPADDGSPYHYKGDAFKVLWATPPWDLIIMHPPCTALAVSGNAWYGEGMPKYQERLDSVEWTKRLFNAAKGCAYHVCMENPVGVLGRLAGLKPTQYIQPYMFGHPEQKKTGLWLRNLPKLVETNNVYEHMKTLPLREQQRLHHLPPSADRWKIRSTTYQGIADAMANQWGTL